MKKFLRQVRSIPSVSVILYSLGRPAFSLAKALQAQIAQRVRRNGGTCLYDGIRLRFPRDVGIGFLSEISWHGVQGFEPHTWYTLRRLIQRSGTFIDIGANICFYSVLAKRIAPQIDVLSFEPVPALCEQSRKFHASNGVPANIYQIAISDTDGRATLYQPDEIETAETAASTLAAASWQARKAHREIIVETAKLDTFLSDRPLHSPVTIKIDVEDHEAAVLRGAADTIRKFRPFVVCEILARPVRAAGSIGSEAIPDSEQHGNAATVTMLGAMNYAVFAITSVGYFRFLAGDFATERRFTDFLLLPNEWVDNRRGYFADLDQILAKSRE
jgi:FkbM family methyltransferase